MVLVCIEDITERKRADKALRESQEKLQRMFESVTDGITVTDLDGVITDVNERVVQMHGVGSKDKMLGKSAFEVIAPRDRERAMVNMQKTTVEGSIGGVEYTLLREDGSEYPGELSASVLKDASGNLVGFIAITRDITERKRAEEELRVRAQLLDAANDVIVVIDLEGNFVYVNEAACKLFGYSLDELMGLGLKALEAPEFAELTESRIKKVIEKGEATFESAALRKDKSLMLLEIHARITESGGKKLIFNIGRDITERKRAEEQLKASLQEKEVLLKEIHHRVKNNLQLISSMFHLQSGYTKNKQVLKILADNRNRVRSLALIHEKLYRSGDLARIAFGEYLRDLLANLLHSYTVGAGAVSLKMVIDEISLDIDTAIPCSLIVNELVANSLKHAFPEGKEGEICIDLHPDNDSKFTLVVSDNGVGFPKGLDFRSTESFGLQLVISLVDQLGATIELDSSAGTAFKITFAAGGGRSKGL